MANILIIEDDQTLQKVYSEVLKQNGHVVTVAGNGPEGMRLFPNQQIDLVLLDIMLPGGMNGFDILSQLKRDDTLKNIPVIVLTNLDSEKQTAKDYGAVDCLFKANMELPALLAAVNSHLK